jgi:transcriptional regulator with XRE-family HTH domain
MARHRNASNTPLAIWRKRKGFTQQHLADISNTSQQQIAKLEKSRRRLRVDQILKLSAALEIPPAALIDGNDFDETDAELVVLLKKFPPAKKLLLLRIARAIEEPGF